MVKLHLLLAVRAIHECEDYPRRRPFVLKNRLDAVNVIDVATTKFDAGLGAQPADIADSAVRVFIGVVKV